MSPERPNTDAGDSNCQVKKNFSPTPGLTPVYDYPKVFEGLRKLHRKHNLPYLNHSGINLAGSPEWTCITERPETLLLVIELKEADRYRWRDIDAEVRRLLKDHRLENKCYVRYYIARQHVWYEEHPEAAMRHMRMAQEAGSELRSTGRPRSPMPGLPPLVSSAAQRPRQVPLPNLRWPGRRARPTTDAHQPPAQSGERNDSTTQQRMAEEFRRAYIDNFLAEQDARRANHEARMSLVEYQDLDQLHMQSDPHHSPSPSHISNEDWRRLVQYEPHPSRTLTPRAARLRAPVPSLPPPPPVEGEYVPPSPDLADVHEAEPLDNASFAGMRLDD